LEGVAKGEGKERRRHEQDHEDETVGGGVRREEDVSSLKGIYTVVAKMCVL
jgi:hypothetical protein